MLLPVELGEAHHSIHTWEWGLQPPETHLVPVWKVVWPSLPKWRSASATEFLVSLRGTPDWSPDTGQEHPGWGVSILRRHKLARGIRHPAYL